MIALVVSLNFDSATVQHSGINPYSVMPTDSPGNEE